MRNWEHLHSTEVEIRMLRMELLTGSHVVVVVVAILRHAKADCSGSGEVKVGALRKVVQLPRGYQLPVKRRVLRSADLQLVIVNGILGG